MSEESYKTTIWIRKYYSLAHNPCCKIKMVIKKLKLKNKYLFLGISTSSKKHTEDSCISKLFIPNG